MRHFAKSLSIAAVLLSVMLVASSSLIGLCSESYTMPLQPEVPKEFANYRHPILNTKPETGLKNQAVTASQFKNLNNYNPGKNESPYIRWEWFQKSEKEASDQFCARVLNLKKAQICALGGPPRFIGSSLPCWTWTKSAGELWLYGFGATNQIIWLQFEKDKCIRSRHASYVESLSFETWKAHQIKEFAIHKTVQEILKKEGLPTYSRNKANSDVDPLSLQCHSLLYLTGNATAAELIIVNGVCTEAGVSWIAH